MNNWYRRDGFIQFLLGNTVRSAGWAERAAFAVTWLLLIVTIVALVFGVGIPAGTVWFAISFALVVIGVAEWFERK